MYKSTFQQADIERLQRFGAVSTFEKTGLGPTLTGQDRRFASGKMSTYPSQPDSGIFSGGLSSLDGGPPNKPRLLVDPENHGSHDSAIGMEETMDTAEDDKVEKDCAVTVTPSVQTAHHHTPPVQKPVIPRKNNKATFRKPRVNSRPPSPATITKAPSPPLPRGSSPMFYSNNEVSQSGDMNSQRTTYRTDPDTCVSAPLERTQREWPRINLFELHKNMQYFLPNTDGDTGLHLSVIHGAKDLLDKLLYIVNKEPQLKPLIDEQNALYQQTDMIKKLLVSGASLHITDHKGNTPLHIAAKFSSTKVLEEIVRYVPLQKLLEVSQVRNNDGLTCIHVAATHSNTDTLRKLRSLSMDINMQEFSSGKTPLHLAVESGSLSNVQFLIETCHARVNDTTYSGCTPLHVASGRGNIAVVAYLVSMGADPELTTDEGDTALDLAGSDQVTTLLTKAAALKWLY